MLLFTSLAVAMLMTAQVATAQAGPAAAPAVIQENQEDPYIAQIYDIRDLTLRARMPERESDPFSATLMQQLCNAMSMSAQPVMPGLIWVQGRQSEHQQLQSSLVRLRELYQDRYEVQLVVMRGDGDQSPTIGDTVERSSAMHATRQVVSGSQPTEVLSLTTHRYVHGYEPVVGDNASGYSTILEDISAGLAAVVAVDSSRDAEAGVSIDITGSVSHVSFDRTMPFIGVKDEGMWIDLPQYTERSFQSHITLQPDKLTALSVVDDFNGEGAIVIAAMVRKVE